MTGKSTERLKLRPALLVIMALAGMGLLAVILGVWSARTTPTILNATTDPSHIAADASPSGTALASPVGTYDVDALQATTVAIVHTLPTTSPDPNLAPDKAASYALKDLWDRAHATAIALYPPPPGYVPPSDTPDANLTPPPTPLMIAAGAGHIIDEGGGQDSTSARLLRVANSWNETIGNRYIVALAGRQTNGGDANQGVIVIIVQDNTSYEIIGDPETYLTPSRHGYVRVTDAVGEQLTLRAEDGTLFGFNIGTRQWVSPSPGPSPSPLQSPLPSPSLSSQPTVSPLATLTP